MIKTWAKQIDNAIAFNLSSQPSLSPFWFINTPILFQEMMSPNWRAPSAVKAPNWPHTCFFPPLTSFWFLLLSTFPSAFFFVLWTWKEVTRTQRASMQNSKTLMLILPTEGLSWGPFTVCSGKLEMSMSLLELSFPKFYWTIKE